jgi:hypothetical protein
MALVLLVNIMGSLLDTLLKIWSGTLYVFSSVSGLISPSHSIKIA